jgi:hypothetical protein
VKVYKYGPIPIRHPELGPCWEWTASATEQGYGMVGITKGGRKTSIGAHRAAYELLIGPIPAGLFLDHLCRNPRCCNPAHLEPVTVDENNLRGNLATRAERCPLGHRYQTNGTVRWCEECFKIRTVTLDNNDAS